MARMKFICDAERCIECNGCVTACKSEHEVPWGVNRRRLVTVNDGMPGERSISVACMHCTDAPCMAVCPVDCFYKTEEGIVLHDKDLCIGCGYCFYACPFGAPQFPQAGAFGLRGKMDKCTYCAGGPEENNTAEEYRKYGRNRLAEGKLPACAEMCSTKALLAGDAEVITRIYKTASSPAARARRSGAGRWLTAAAASSPTNREERHEKARIRGRRCWRPPSGSAAAPRSPRSPASPTPARKTTKAYAGDQFKGDKAKWEQSLATRADIQNDYRRADGREEIDRERRQ